MRDPACLALLLQLLVLLSCPSGTRAFIPTPKPGAGGSRFPAYPAASAAPPKAVLDPNVRDLSRIADYASAVEVRDTPGRGTGIFAIRDFRRGELVLEGEVEGKLPHNDAHASQVSRTLWVRHKYPIPLVNHSCGPNLGIHANPRTGGHDFVAFRDIHAGEEICFDYAMRNWQIEHFPPRCLCGAPECRGTISGYKDLPLSRRRDYTGFTAPYCLEMALAEDGV